MMTKAAAIREWKKMVLPAMRRQEHSFEQSP
jgi:hypothetical protein